MKASIVIATYCPSKERLDLVERSFLNLHATGIPRDEYELIICDNGGFQPDLIMALEPDLKITYSKNVGQPAALNAGISAARGEVIFQMDDDLLYGQGWVAYGLGMLDTYPSAIVQLRPPISPIVETTRGGHGIVTRHGGHYIARREVFRKCGPFSTEHYRWAGLWERQASRRGYRFLVAKDPQIVHLGEGHSLLRETDLWRTR